MPVIINLRKLSYVWKQTLVTILSILILGSVLIYVYVHKQYMTLMEHDYLQHWKAMQRLQQELEGSGSTYTSLSIFIESQRVQLFQTTSAFFEDVPGVFRLSILNMESILLYGKEMKDMTEFFQSTSTSSPRRAIKNTMQLFINNQAHSVQLPLRIGNQRLGLLRGEFFVNTSHLSYIRIAKATLYMTIASSIGMVFLGIILILTHITRHLSLKQAKLEEYAFSLEHANENLRRTKKELRVSEKLASLGYLAAGIAHEIGNPLGSVLGYVELLEKNRLEKEKSEDILRRIKHEIERIRRIIQELVHFSRPRALNIHTVDINHVLRKMASQWPSDRQKQIDMQLSLTEFPLWAEVDEHKLQSVFFNILSNSRDAIATRGNIRIATSRRIRETSTMIGGSEVIAIQFADTGHGISEADLSKIFDPFFTTKEPGSGMGLGLSLCHRMIETLNGEIEVQSTPGKGTDLTIFLPPARKKAESGYMISDGC